MDVHKRKVQSFAKYSYAVTLPIHWIKKNSLEKPKQSSADSPSGGAEEPAVDIYELADGSLQIFPENHQFQKTEKIVLIDFDDLIKKNPNFMEEKGISMILISHYMNGAAGLEIVSKKPFPQEFIEQVERTQSRLLFNWNMSLETNRRILIKNIFTEAQDQMFQEEIPRFLRESFAIILGIIEDLLDAVSEKEYNSLARISERDDKIDRYYFFIVRQIRNLGGPQFSHPQNYNHKKLIDLRLLAKIIEEVGDSLKDVANVIYKLHYFLDEIGLHQYFIDYFTVLKESYSALADILRNYLESQGPSQGINPEIMIKIQKFRQQGHVLEKQWFNITEKLKIKIEKYRFSDYYQGARLIKNLEEIYTQVFDFTNLFF